jgi:hypothetical protein
MVLEEDVPQRCYDNLIEDNIMKKIRKLGLSFDTLKAAKDVEASLAKEASKGISDGLPDGHPLKNEAERLKMMMGDLSGLPEGHPLIRTMQAAKERFDQQQAQKEEEQKNASENNKSAKTETDRVRQVSRRAEEDKNTKMNEAIGLVNKGLEGTLEEVRKLYKTMADNEENLNIDPLSRAKVNRLRRFLFAAERGLSECKIVKVRI